MTDELFLTNQIGKLRAELAAANARIAELNGEVEAVRVELPGKPKSGLAAKVAELRENFFRVRASRHTLRNERIAAQKNVERTMSDVGNLVDRHQAELAAVKAERDAFEERCRVLAADFLSAADERDKCCDDYQREAARAVAAETERDATEEALRKWCARLHKGWRDAVFSEDLRREYCNDIANMQAAGLWREPTGESNG